MDFHITTTIKQSFSGLLVFAVLFVVLEPAISYGNQFTISQTVNGEVAFATGASNVVMAPSLGGVTGGTSNGGTQFAIISNDTAGFRVTVQSTTTDGRMVGMASSTNSIPGYTAGTPGVPDYNFTVAANAAEFGYTVNSTNTPDVAQAFRNNGSSCNTGATADLVHCWLAATTTAYTAINRTMPTFGTPASSTIAFRVVINANPSPMIPNDIYVSTTTLTAVAN